MKRKPKNWLRREVYYAVTSEWFEMVIMVVIGCTIVTMCLRHANQVFHFSHTPAPTPLPASFKAPTVVFAITDAELAATG